MFFGMETKPCISACCEKCFQFNWIRQANGYGGCNPGKLGGTVTLEWPSSYEIPSGGFSVTFQGGGDDKVRVNGDWFGNETQCFTDSIYKTIRVNSRTITFEFYDTVGGNVGGGACVCVDGVPAPTFERTALDQSGGTLEIDGWKLTYPPIVQTSNWYGGIQWYLDNSAAYNCERLNPLP